MQFNSIAEQIFFSTVRIDTVAADGTQGAGTGFIFAHKSGDRVFPFIVTNKHVIMNVKEGYFSFHRQIDGVPQIGNGFKLNVDKFQHMWFGHPSNDVDIAICALAPLGNYIMNKYNVDIFVRAISSEMIPTSQQIDDLDAIELITFIGYPNGIWDSSNLLPIARRGATASPLQVDFENSPRFLIDASVFGGSSGSPVFILDQSFYTIKNGGLVMGSQCYFIGVIHAVFFRTQINSIEPTPIPTIINSMVQQQEMIDLGIVFKARTVVETVEAFLASNPSAR